VSAKAERLVNLTIALLETRRPLSFADIRRRTGYYDQRDRESARRMFERDKDDLRALGVPIDIREVAFGEEPGYIIDRSSYEAPDIDLEPEEVAALALALEVTDMRGAALALAKVAARAPDPASLGVRPTALVDVDADEIDPVAEAVLERIPLRFAYRGADGRESTRVLDPYAVLRRRRAWYIVGRDHDRDALRAFRLDRIIGRPMHAGDAGAFVVPEDADVLSLVTGPAGEPLEVVLRVGEAARWAVVARGGVVTDEDPGTAARMRIADIDMVRDRAWLLGLAPDAVVEAPDGVRDDLVRAFEDLVRLHDGAEAAS